MNHGTVAAYWRHRRAKEKACDDCRAAYSRYQVKQRAAKRPPRETKPETPYTREMDALLAEAPPVIEWVFCQRRRVIVAADIKDPHTPDPRRAA